ncbi:MAG: glycoside hydrolase family 13 protein [Bacteroidales bacterium]|nr:glycoside hydrolase family 13 protein [Bacteroidales bacterium]
MNNIPTWAAEAVWYQIFPDRFCRFNSHNPITAQDIEGTTPWTLNSSHPWQIHPWASDWYARQDYERANRESLKTNILRRRYCGDIRGIISKLDYLKDLGINAIYLNPIQYSPSLHKYDGTDFMHVDPFLGSNPLADRDMIEQEDFDDFDNACWTSADMEALELIAEVHNRGMRIVFDGVFNHIGYNSKPFQHVLRFPKFSRYSSWFLLDLAKSTPEKLCYEKFWGCVDEMPKLNYGSPMVKKYIFAVLKRWLKPVVNGVEYQGIDGWRLDHVIGVPPSFWKSAYNFTKKLNKNSLFLAELIEPNEIVKPYLDNAIFDSVMNYGFYFLACEFFAGERNVISALDFDKRLRSQLSLFPMHCNYLMMNLLGTHDTERLASLIVNRKLKKYDDIATFFQNTHIEDKGYVSRSPNADERLIQKMMIAFEFSMIGSPMVYYGDELGMWGANDPDCRKPMVWSHLHFTSEHLVKSGRHYRDRVEKVSPSQDMYLFYKNIIALRNYNPVLSRGTLQTDFAHPRRRILAYSRQGGGDRIIFAFNREKTAVELDIPCCEGDVFLDYLNSGEELHASQNTVKIALQPLTFRILIKRTSTNQS